ncbi:MAG: type II secretion system F family protein [Deltaproteobacteria bacterium]|nr:type II secretion system F family protein [Deltaproteobacteria bacterium]
MILFISVSVFLAASLGALALFWWAESRRESLSRRFQAVLAGGEVGGVPRSFGWWAEWASRFRIAKKADPAAGEDIVARVTGDLSGSWMLLNQAGYRNPSSIRTYWIARAGLPVVFVAAAILIGRAVGISDRGIACFAAFVAAGGWFLPVAFLKARARKRQEEIIDALPDSLDLLTVCVEAGLGINSAFSKIGEEFRLSCPVLSEEFDIVNREMVAGKPRAEALRALAARTGVEDVKSLVAMLIQTEKLGTSLAQSLRVHSDSLRTRRRQRAEEAAAKTTIKLVFPLVFLLFPALFIVILGPGVLQILHILFPVALGGNP